MGASSASGFPNQRTSDSFYGGANPLKPHGVAGRRTMPGGPLLPRLPNNPLATMARRIGRSLNTPKLPPYLGRQP